MLTVGPTVDRLHIAISGRYHDAIAALLLRVVEGVVSGEG